MVEVDVALTAWLKPFVKKPGHKKRRQRCPVHVSDLSGPGERKSVGPIAECRAPEPYDRLHHFIVESLIVASEEKSQQHVTDRRRGSS